MHYMDMNEAYRCLYGILGRRGGGASKTRDGEDKGGQERQEKGWLRG